VLGLLASAPTVCRILDKVTGTRLKRIRAGRARTRRQVWGLLGSIRWARGLTTPKSSWPRSWVPALNAALDGMGIPAVGRALMGWGLSA